MVDRARLESRVLAEMAALVSSDQEYRDVVQSILDLVEEVVLSPLLALVVQEPDQIRQYYRLAPGNDQGWGQEAVSFAAEVARQDLSHAVSGRLREHNLLSPPTWLALFGASTRSGRSSALLLGAPQPLSVSAEEEQLMLRLACQAALVLDHVLLLGQVEELEVTDGLTGVVNHRRLLEILEYEMQRQRYSGHRLALMIIDVEGLNGINLTYGRQYGNHILRRLAGMLREVVRPIDVVARSGLDEFAVVLPDTDDEDGERLADAVRERIQGVEFAGGAIGLSVGVTHVRPDETLSAEGFLRRAEQALQEAKRQDRSRSALYAPGSMRGLRGQAPHV